MLNNLYIIGNLTKDVKITLTKNGCKIANFSIAFKSQNKNERGEFTSVFLNCRAIGNIADLVERFCSKGDKIGLTGSLFQENYQNNSEIKLLISNVELINSYSKKPQLAETETEEVENISSDEDLPF